MSQNSSTHQSRIDSIRITPITYIHLSFFVELYLTVSQICGVAPKINASLRLLSEQEHKNRLTTRTGLRSIPHDIPRVEGNKRQHSRHKGSAKKEKINKINVKNFPFLREGLDIHGIALYTGRLGTQLPRKARVVIFAVDVFFVWCLHNPLTNRTHILHTSTAISYSTSL